MYSNLYRIALCLSHARLSLRKEAVEEDAVLAIMLYEEALVHKTGNDIFIHSGFSLHFLVVVTTRPFALLIMVCPAPLSLFDST